MVWFRAFALLLLTLGSTSVLSRSIQTFTGATIPASISLPSAGIFKGSDSLFLNQRLLARGIEYVVDQPNRSLTLTRDIAPTDTLTVVYYEIPGWLTKTYGRDIPDPHNPLSAVPIPPEAGDLNARSGFAKDIRLSGAKTFRFTSRTEGDAEFGQSLDLKVSGELSPGLELTGALSDRGYDPSYGTATSRLSELDKLNLQLKSNRLLARIGDISIPSGQTGVAKSVSGASIDLHYPIWKAHAAAARPRGRFESATLLGQDRFQGPYQIGSGGSVNPVVPGSEIVWLDGRRLERGSDKDYTVDYAAGSITFTVRHPIDRRSRIEIDFEPLATTYRQEMLSLGGGVSHKDSIFYVATGVVREGDDREQMLIGELSDLERSALEQGGDADIFQSGVTSDSAGDYDLIVDSLPDSVFSYAGAGGGEFRIVFTYVGSGKGEYRFVGGNSYQFVGASNGDYLPVRKIPRPERADFYTGTVGFKTRYGRLTADIRQTSLDRNLWSDLDDADNEGIFYNVAYRHDWQWGERTNSLVVQRRMREPTFWTRERLIEPDQNRTYLVPAGFRPAENELIHRAEMSFSPASWIRLSPHWSRLEYQGRFQSSLGAFGLEINPTNRLRLTSSFRLLESDLDSSGATRTGTARSIRSDIQYSLFKDVKALAGYEYDQREYDYAGLPAGLRFDRYAFGVGSVTESIRYERYVEDSLESAWFSSGERDRISAQSTRQIGYLNLNSEVTWQSLDDRTARRLSFLGRATLSYAHAPAKLQAQSSYVISQELRNERGITYLEVEPGRGNYSYEDGSYLPDPFGNFIQVEELLSEQAEVRRGEKSFQLSKDLTFANLRFSSSIKEELLENGKRAIWWVIPFLTDESQPYLNLARRYDSEVRLVPWRNFYAVNLTISDEIELRSVAGRSNQRRDSRGSVTFKQAAGTFLLEQSAEYFSSSRDQYYAGAGDVDGFSVSGIVRRVMSSVEWSGGGAVRRAESENLERSQLYALLAGIRIKALGRGEVRSDVELYRQELDPGSSEYGYLLTDNHNGKRGAIWTVGLRYSVRQGIQVNLNFQGRHSDERTGRVAGRGEVVASF